MNRRIPITVGWLLLGAACSSNSSDGGVGAQAGSGGSTAGHAGSSAGADHPGSGAGAGAGGATVVGGSGSNSGAGAGDAAPADVVDAGVDTSVVQDVAAPPSDRAAESDAWDASAAAPPEAGREAGPAIPCMPPIPVTSGAAATVTVDVANQLATVGEDLMGLHMAVYDGRMGTPAVVDLLRGAGVTSLRYPGGSYADLYHWESHTAYTSSPAMGAGSTTITITPGTDFGHFVGLLNQVNAHAFVTLNYGSNSTGTGPGDPHEAAAWVAYANATVDNTAVIGVDAAGHDWGTAGDWARLRAASPITPDDGKNMLRIARALPVGVKYWELGNELYGNGYFGVGGACGWEVDLHAPYSSKECPGRVGNAALSPIAYGKALRAFSEAIKKVDPTVKLGAIVLWPVVNNSYPNWNASVLGQGCSPTPAIDFVVSHWYPGTTVASLLTIPSKDIPAMYRDLHANLASLCGSSAATMPIAVTEWGPDTLYSGAAIGKAFNPAPPATPSQTQVGGIFAAESYANFMEQGALALHFQQLHPGASGATYLDGNDKPSWGYHGQQIAHFLAQPNDTLLPTTSSVPTVLSHAARGADGGINVMLSNTSASTAANVTIKLSGGSRALACGGSRYLYTPINADVDGTVTGPQPIYASADGSSVSVAVPPYSVVVVSFAKR